MSKSLGIVLPTIGREKFLDIAISSLLNQSTKCDEFLIFDNSVSQNLKDISKYGENTSITWVKSGKQLGPIESWNKAISSSSCEYVVVAGDDDIFQNNYVEEAKRIINKADLGFLRPYVIDENENVLSLPPFPEENILTSDEFRYHRFYKKTSLFVPGAVFKKSIFEKIGGYENSGLPSLYFSDDLLYFKMACLSKKVAFSNIKSWNYRVHSGQIGNVQSLENLIDDSIEYLKLFENRMISLETKTNKIYTEDYHRNDYLNHITRYCITVFTSKKLSEGISNVNLISKIYRNYLIDSRVLLFSRIKTFLIVLKILAGSTKLGKIIKKAKNG